MAAIHCSSWVLHSPFLGSLNLSLRTDDVWQEYYEYLELVSSSSGFS